MRLRDLQLLPKTSEELTFLYVERACIEQDQNAIVLIDDTGRVSIPVATLQVLMLGPGTSITHAAMVACANNKCFVLFCGEAGVRLYAGGTGETYRANNLLHQARIWADENKRLDVVLKMYRMRFEDLVDSSLTLEQVRGMEGARVRDTYARMAKETGIEWTGRSYSGEWNASTPVNRALSTANACLYGLCHAAIVSTGFSPAIGFVHTGKTLSFVYDIADLYKCEVTIPIAFQSSKGPLDGLESRVRIACRNRFRESKLIERIVPDIQRILSLRADVVRLVDLSEPDSVLWDPAGDVPGCHNYDPDRAHVLSAEEVA